MDKILVMRTASSIRHFTQFVLHIKGLIKNPNPIALEIGAYLGDSTKILCDHFGRVITIDPWENIDTVYVLFKEHIKDCKNLTIYRDYSFNIYDRFKDESLDALYVDGNHDYLNAHRDLTLYIPKVKHGGIISGHDHGHVRFPGVAKAVNELLGKPEKVFADHSWLVRKR